MEDVIFSKLLFQFVQFVQMIENKIVEFRVELYEGKVEDLFSQNICRLGMRIQYKKFKKWMNVTLSLQFHDFSNGFFFGWIYITFI